MDIKLIFPPFEQNTYDRCLLPPLSIVSLHSYLKKRGYNSRLYDLELESFLSVKSKSKINFQVLSDRQRIKKYLEGKKDFYLELQLERIINSFEMFDHNVFCFSIIDISQLFISLAIAKFLTKKYQSTIIFGGPYITLNKGFVLEQFCFVDYEITGASEDSLYQLILSLDKKLDVSKVPNLLYAKDGKTVYNTNKEFDINNSEMPDFNALPIEKYRVNGNLVLPYQLVSGCNENCFFCAHRTINPLIKMKDVDKVIKELKELKEKHNVRHFYFCDNLINADNSYLEELCDRIIEEELDILWIDHAKPDILSQELMQKIRKSGCVQLYYGIESASESVLKKMNKHLSINDVKKCLELSHKAGIWNHVSFIVGYLGETEKDFDTTLNFILENKNAIDSIMVSPFYIPKKSIIYNNPSRFNVALNISDSTQVMVSFDDLTNQNSEEVITDRMTKIGSLIDKFNLFPFKLKNNKILSINMFFDLCSELKDKSIFKQRIKTL